MKKLSIILSLVIASFLFFTTSCGTSSSSSPSSPADISKKLLKDTEKGNVNAVIALYSKETTDEYKDLITNSVKLIQKIIKERDGIKSIEIIKEYIDEEGDEAEVKIRIVYGNGEEEVALYKFVMEDGKWKRLLE